MVADGSGALLPGGGVGSLAVGGWLLHLAGMPTRQILQRSSGLFFLTSAINVMVLAAGGLRPAPWGSEAALTMCCGRGCRLPSPWPPSSSVLGMPRIMHRVSSRLPAPAWLEDIGTGIPAARDALLRPSWRLLGALGYLLFDMAVLWTTLAAVGPAPPVAALAVAYLAGISPNVAPYPGWDWHPRCRTGRCPRALRAAFYSTPPRRSSSTTRLRSGSRPSAGCWRTPACAPAGFPGASIDSNEAGHSLPAHAAENVHVTGRGGWWPSRRRVARIAPGHFLARRVIGDQRPVPRAPRASRAKKRRLPRCAESRSPVADAHRRTGTRVAGLRLAAEPKAHRTVEIAQTGPEVVRLGAVDDRIDRVAELPHEAGETHHRVYRIVDGDDPDWASWYAEWLRDLPELPQILGAPPVRSELVWLLVTLDQEYTKASPSTPWPRWYAERVLEHFAPPRANRSVVG